MSPQYFHLRGGKLAESVVSVHSLGPVIGGGQSGAGGGCHTSLVHAGVGAGLRVGAGDGRRVCKRRPRRGNPRPGPRARSRRAPPRAPPPPRSAPGAAAAPRCHWCPAVTRARWPGRRAAGAGVGGRRGGRARGAADETRAQDASRPPHFIHSARAGVSRGSPASGARDYQLSATPASDPARRASARSSGSPTDPRPNVRPVQLRLCPTERPSVQPWLGRLSSDGPARILPPCRFGECPACRVWVTFVGWGGGGVIPALRGAAAGQRRVRARGGSGVGVRWHSLGGRAGRAGRRADGARGRCPCGCLRYGVHFASLKTRRGA